MTIGFDGLKEMFGPPNPIVGQSAWLVILLLVGPPLLMFLTRFPSSIRGASAIFIIYSVVYAVSNGTLEEVFWRGTFVVGI